MAEQLYYTIPDAAGVRVEKAAVPGYPTDNYTDPNQFVHKLNGNGTKVGTSMVLKVMSGDRVNIHAKSWYRLNGVTPGSTVSPLTDLVAALAGGVAQSAAGKYTAGELIGNGSLSPGMTDMLTTQAYSSTTPKAYLNWVLFDEQFRYVDTGSGFDQVGADQELKQHILRNLPVTKNGYLYIYISNETPNVDVFFDNLQVTHIRGPLLEETHYYPFGLTMAGISSKAAGKMENRYKYNGIELNEDLGLNTYDAFFRNLDQQTGRWWQIDPKIESMEMWSPYASNYNNPIRFNDPLGDEPCCQELWKDIKSAVSETGKSIKREAVDFWNGKGKVYDGLDWVNRNLNPLTDVYHAATGKDFITGEKVSRTEATAGILLMAVGAKAEVAAINAVEKVVAKEFAIGGYSELKVAAKGTGLEAHHVGQAAAMEKLIPEYNRKTAPSILVKKEGHTTMGANGILKRTTAANSPATARDVLARDIKELRRVFHVPNNPLQELIQMNKNMYPDAFKKKSL